MSKKNIETNVSINSNVMGLMKDTLGYFFGEDDFKAISEAMVNDPRNYDYQIAKAADLYFEKAEFPLISEECREPGRYEIEMCMRMYIYNKYAAEMEKKHDEAEDDNEDTNNGEMPDKCKECGKCKNIDEVNKHHKASEELYKAAESDPFLRMILSIIE